MTHTYVTMAVSRQTFEEIKKKLEEAGWHQAIHKDTFQKVEGVHDQFYMLTLDMHGIGLILEPDVVTDENEQQKKLSLCEKLY